VSLGMGGRRGTEAVPGATSPARTHQTHPLETAQKSEE
jgi:hypothetical protein